MAEQEKELDLHKPDRTSTDLAVFSTIEGFETGIRMANALSSSSIVPQNFQGQNNLGSCLIALDLAARMGLNPLVLMRGLYVVHGTPSFSGQFVIALVNSSGLYKTKLKFEPVGEVGKPSFGYRCYAYDWDGDKVYGPVVDMQMAASEGWISKNPKWKSMPDLMLRYRAGAFFQRTNAPELTFGIPTREEVEDTEGVVDVPQHEVVEVNVDEVPVAEVKEAKATPSPAPPIQPEEEF
ncbi:hypothetical protein [Clavibacter sp.]|uniref:hypothetical protein n=1 Tax=Clavibacter sp. TaxID=1871044 RepID=UPI0019A5EC78|nr:hypothetical protein [Clavibacter sp.]MBD5381983.1 recombinase RecT [Clavibacter sp.]